MSWQPGQSGNPKGRPKGSKNKATKEIRTKILGIINEQYSQILEDLKELEPKERIDCWIKLLDFALPKLQRVESDTRIDLSSLTDEEVRELLERAVEMAENQN